MKTKISQNAAIMLLEASMLVLDFLNFARGDLKHRGETQTHRDNLRRAIFAAEHGSSDEPNNCTDCTRLRTLLKRAYLTIINFPLATLNTKSHHEARTLIATIAQELEEEIKPELSGEQLVQNAMDSLHYRYAHGDLPFWSHVGKMFGVGSTTASAICYWTGYDPDTGVKYEGT